MPEMDYFGSKSQKSPSAGGSYSSHPCLQRLGASRPDSRLGSMNNLENVQDPTPIKQFWLMQMLGNFGATRNLNFTFSTFPLSKKKFSRHWAVWAIGHSLYPTKRKRLFVILQVHG